MRDASEPTRPSGTTIRDTIDTDYSTAQTLMYDDRRRSPALETLNNSRSLSAIQPYPTKSNQDPNTSNQNQLNPSTSFELAHEQVAHGFINVRGDKASDGPGQEEVRAQCPVIVEVEIHLYHPIDNRSLDAVSRI